jgi:hypothetical protein
MLRHLHTDIWLDLDFLSFFSQCEGSTKRFIFCIYLCDHDLHGLHEETGMVLLLAKFGAGAGLVVSMVSWK